VANLLWLDFIYQFAFFLFPKIQLLLSFERSTFDPFNLVCQREILFTGVFLCTRLTYYTKPIIFGQEIQLTAIAFGIFARTLPATKEFIYLREKVQYLDLADSIGADAHKCLNVVSPSLIFPLTLTLSIILCHPLPNPTSHYLLKILALRRSFPPHPACHNPRKRPLERQRSLSRHRRICHSFTTQHLPLQLIPLSRSPNLCRSPKPRTVRPPGIIRETDPSSESGGVLDLRPEGVNPLADSYVGD
jgi:hypothetical protein